MATTVPKPPTWHIYVSKSPLIVEVPLQELTKYTEEVAKVINTLRRDRRSKAKQITNLRNHLKTLQASFIKKIEENKRLRENQLHD